MANLTTLIQHVRGLSSITKDLIQQLDAVQDTPDIGVLTEDNVKDLWAFNLLLAEGKSLEDIQSHNSALFQRIQARYMTQAEQMQARLASLPFSP